MKKFTIIIFTVFIAQIAIAQITFSGQLKNAETSGPIESAFIRIKNSEKTYSTYSTSNGSFIIENVTKGTYTLAISHIGYNTLVESIEVSTPGSELIFLEPDMEFLDAAIITTVRAKNSTPTTFTNIDKKEIQAMDQSKDFPFLLNTTPSTVISSDAGNGIGYTGIRIRGIDPTRVNVTVNGIPINDAESQGMYWVNMPDIASSTQSVQIQRGLGTSTNGAAAFGASVNIRTNDLPQDQTPTASLGLGSFNTSRATFSYASGRLKKNWAYQLRGSLIQSDGYIDRASSNLKSLNVTAAKYWEKSVLKTNILIGKERTYQAWLGIPEPKINQNPSRLNFYTSWDTYTFDSPEKVQNINASNSRTANIYTYENEVDNYNQNHYQFFYDYNPISSVKINSAFYITTGKGYFEQFKPNENFAKYGIGPLQNNGDSAVSGDLIRRRWLDNTLIGGIASANYRKNKIDLTIGGGYSHYAGKHFGEAIATQFTTYEALNTEYYNNDATKTDANFYVKKSYNWNNLIPYIDLQFRAVNYQFEGLDSTLAYAPQEANYVFFNPKMGLTYLVNNHTFYGVWAQGNREPVRDDFRNNKPTDWPEHEKLSNVELGYRYAKDRIQLGINLYSMEYTNQLVLTGAVNDVGEVIRTNVDESYRRGIELEFQYPVTKKLQFGGNATFSDNKIVSFTESLSEWDGAYQTFSNEYKNTSISFSPNSIAAAMLSYKVNSNFTFNMQGKYVGQQFLDNTESEQRNLDAFTVLDASVNYNNGEIKGIKNLTIGFYLNNVLNEFYAPNGYTFSGVIDNKRRDFNYLYPMAGFNWMMKIGIML